MDLLRSTLSTGLLVCAPLVHAQAPAVPVLSSKPYARYWWFASNIKPQDVRYNLDHLKTNGFGGVEVAWVYPLNRFNKKDTTYTPRQEWLSPEWTSIVDYTLHYADSIGMGCDLTFGTLWPFGDSYVTHEEGTQRYGDAQWRQELTRSWEHPKPGYVVDHLTPSYYQRYFDRLLKAFPRLPGSKLTSAYFIDSWEVETEKLWCNGFEKDFKAKCGYDILPYMDSIYTPANKLHLYDYMGLVSDKVLRFYRDYDSTLNSVGILSRGQVSGAPCDLISGYATMDIPEGESMLFEPEFCAIPASAALLTGRKYVSSETFTCLYGWPRDYMRKEQTADLKLVSDALFANGINHIIWHGKAHNPAGQDTVNFYATTHIGDNSAMAAEVKPFNQYLEKVQSYMRKGKTYADVAVYLPTEDAWTAGVMPKEKQFIWAWGHYEMRYVYFPQELDGHCPAWINGEFLQKAEVKGGRICVGDASFAALYLDVEYLDKAVLKRLNELADAGATIVLKRAPKPAGAAGAPTFTKDLERLQRNRNTFASLPQRIMPLVESTTTLRHYCRQEGDALYVFFANPKADRIKFPMGFGQGLDTETRTAQATIHHGGRRFPITLTFAPYQSLLYKVQGNRAESMDITFLPKTPVVEARPAGYIAPWLPK
jgi:alpha-L-rhamnosidase